MNIKCDNETYERIQKVRDSLIQSKIVIEVEERRQGDTEGEVEWMRSFGRGRLDEVEWMRQSR